MASEFPTAPNKPMMDRNSEEYWRARYDANTLREAESVKADAVRLKNAVYILELEEAERKAALANAQKAAKKA
jgi:hypothetical protein